MTRSVIVTRAGCNPFDQTHIFQTQSALPTDLIISNYAMRLVVIWRSGDLAIVELTIISS
jgi:hypothetical protein